MTNNHENQGDAGEQTVPKVHNALTDAKVREHRRDRLRDAIDDSSLLVAFIAASKKEAPKAEVAKLIKIQHAYAGDPKLSEQEETDFWLAYSALATAIRPATVEGIRYVAPNKNLGFIGWMWKNRWITLTVAIIAIVYLGVQIHVVRGSSILSGYNATLADLEKADQAEPKSEDKIVTLTNQLDGLRKELITWMFDPAIKLGRSDTAEMVAANQDPVMRAKIEIETASSYLLPFLLGMLGACTQVLRSIARRIGEQSMNPTLLPTYYIRVLMGYIIGTIIGLFMLPSIGGTTTNPFSLLASLPLLTAAFIAGYAAEVLFVALDKIVNDARDYVSGEKKDS